MKIVSRGIAFAPAMGTDRQCCAFPGICALPTGRWLCTCRAAPSKTGMALQHVLLTWSDDAGRTWHEPVAPFKPDPVNGKPGLYRVANLTAMGGKQVLAIIYWVNNSDPALPFFNETTEGLLDSRLFTALSNDSGATWSKPKLLDTSPYNVPTPCTGPVMLLKNGEWAIQFETNKTYYDTSTWQHASVLMFSADGGKTWPRHVKVSYDPAARFFYWDQRPVVLPDGRIMDLFWTFDRKESVYLNIHARESHDLGHTWSEIWDTGVPGQPAPLAALPDRRLAMVYVDRTAAPVIKLRVSSDGGRSWPADTEMDIYRSNLGIQEGMKKSMQAAWEEMGKYSVGLPCTTTLLDGDILAAYYAGPQTNFTGVEWVRIRA